MEQLSFTIQGCDCESEPKNDLTLPAQNPVPLAFRMRPETIDDYVGQKHVLDKGKLLRRAIEADRFTSIILSGPPGVGKTSLAGLIAKKTNSAFIRLSGVISNVSDIRREIASASLRKQTSGRNTILFIDEIHRFNKSQQDVLLPDVESGNIRLIGATTHNPNFYIIPPLVSRSLVFQLESLDKEEIKIILRRALSKDSELSSQKIKITPEAVDFIASTCEGDARRALNALEVAILTTVSKNKAGALKITEEIARESIQKKMILYNDDEHYDTASAFIKSMRGSDPDAALYWLAKMLHAGDDIRFIARRIVIFASEDIGNADPRAVSLAVNAMQAVEMIGLPEAKLILSQAVTYCATAPKSNASYLAIKQALADVENEKVQPVPRYLRDPHSSTGSCKDKADYQYPHNFNEHFVNQDYLGVNKSYYSPADSGYEKKIRERVNYWNSLRMKK